MKPWKAFTILELLVVVLLTSLIVLMAMSILQIIQQQYTDFEAEHRDALSLNEFQVLLRTDFIQSDYVQMDDYHLAIQYPTHQVHYQMAPDFIIRTIMHQYERRDTFLLQVEQLTASFQGQPQTNGWLDFLSMTLVVEGERLPLAFRKQYSALDLMKLNYANQN
ncbi:MAG: hypothetical protein AAGD05_17360 [Bacteroidota bacterium]